MGDDVTKKWVKFKMEMNRQLDEASRWWGIKQKIKIRLRDDTPFIVDYGVAPCLMQKDEAEVSVFNKNSWKTLNEVKKWYICYHEVGHIKFWYDGYPIPVLEADEVTNYPTHLNAVRVFPDRIFTKYTHLSVPLFRDLYERCNDYLTDSTLATRFKSKSLEVIKLLLQEGDVVYPKTPTPQYMAFIRTIDQASFYSIYQLTTFKDIEIEERITKKISDLGKDLPNAREIFESAKDMFSCVRFTTDMDVIVKWTENVHSLMPEINFNS